MLEFSSISVSSYDAASLADKLTEKSGDGWGVVSIVAAGTNVTAYLSRERDEAAGDLTTESRAEAPVSDVAAGEPAFEPVLPAAAAATPGPAVEEPAGWAVEPEPVSPAAAATTTEASSWGSGASTETQPTTQPAAEPEPEPEPVAAQQAAETSAAAQTAQASAATAPAGWYADPSGRYELRYWDGTQWTEHVSRAGQQYTDPPVA